MKFTATTLAIAIAIAQLASAESLLVKGSGDLTPLTINEALSAVRPGEVVIVSESHNYEVHHNHQVMALEALSLTLPKISVGMEFFYFPNQKAVDSYVQGETSETDFLSAIKWGKNDFNFYRRQVLFPRDHLGRTIAINSPPSLTAKIRNTGLESLTENEKGLLPPNFELGNDLYRERFAEAAKDHFSDPKALQRYFEAQSAWDDTMAFITCEYLKKYRDQVMVIVVGKFHAEYGGGLPDRLMKRGCRKVTTVAQTYVESLKDPNLGDALKPDPRYGQLGDFIWVSDDPPASPKDD